MNEKLKKGECWIEIVRGVEGRSLYISDDNGGHRLSGRKPWGGGKTERRFKVNLDELIREAILLKHESDNPVD